MLQAIIFCTPSFNRTCISTPSQGQGYVPRVALLAQQKAALRNAERESERQPKQQSENSRFGAGSVNRRPSNSGGMNTSRRELAPVKDRTNYG